MELVNSNTTLSEKTSLPSQINHIINQISTLINIQLQASIKFYYFLFFTIIQFQIKLPAHFQRLFPSFFDTTSARHICNLSYGFIQFKR